MRFSAVSAVNFERTLDREIESVFLMSVARNHALGGKICRSYLNDTTAFLQFEKRKLKLETSHNPVSHKERAEMKRTKEAVVTAIYKEKEF